MARLKPYNVIVLQHANHRWVIREATFVKVSLATDDLNPHAFARDSVEYDARVDLKDQLDHRTGFQVIAHLFRWYLEALRELLIPHFAIIQRPAIALNRGKIRLIHAGILSLITDYIDRARGNESLAPA